MKISDLLTNEALLKAESALSRADSENIIELCRDYLRLLDEYRDELYRLRGTPEIDLHHSSSSGGKSVEQSRKAVRAALENTVSERNRVESLLESFTSISGYKAAETFNQLKYKGFDNWVIQSGGVKPKDGTGNELMTIQEAVETAGKLRREAYVEHKTVF
jgi:hypothetical protein